MTKRFMEDLTELERSDPLKYVRPACLPPCLPPSHHPSLPPCHFLTAVTTYPPLLHSLPSSLPPSFSVSLLVSNDVLEYEILLFNTSNHERLPQNHTKNHALRLTYPSLPPSLPPFFSVSLLVSNDVLEYEISLLNTSNPERLEESEKMIRDAELNMKLNLLVRREGGREGGRVYRFLNTSDPERLEESEKMVRLNMKLNLLVRREGGREGGLWLLCLSSHTYLLTHTLPSLPPSLPPSLLQVLRVQREEVTMEQYVSMLVERVKRDQVCLPSLPLSLPPSFHPTFPSSNKSSLPPSPPSLSCSPST